MGFVKAITEWAMTPWGQNVPIHIAWFLFWVAALAVDYGGDPLDIGFNISYLLDVLNHVDSQDVSFALGDANSSALVQIPGRDDFKYVVMPMRI